MSKLFSLGFIHGGTKEKKCGRQTNRDLPKTPDERGSEARFGGVG